MTGIRVLRCLLSLPLLAACAAPLQPIGLHSLVPVAHAAANELAAPPALEAPRLLAIGRVWLPEEVDRPELVVRTATGELGLLDAERWSESLKAQLPRALALALAERVPDVATSAYPAPPPVAPAWRLTLEVQRFELQTGPSGRAVLRVLWTLKPPTGESTTRVRELTTTAPSSSPTALVAAMGQALAGLADDVAAALR